MPKDAREDRNQTNSLVANAMDQYSNLAEERDTIICFFLRYEIGEPPNMIRCPVRDFHEMGHVPQSGSQKPAS